MAPEPEQRTDDDSDQDSEQPAGARTAPGTEQLTIDELARRAGITTRNVRAYQERGLLPPPERVGRTGYYGEVHLARLMVVGNLLERGYSLASIGELLGAWDAGSNLGELLGFEHALARPWIDERPRHLDRGQVEAMFGSNPDDLARALELELVIPDGDGFQAPSMKALDAGADLVAAGVTLEAVLDEAAALRADADRIAARFVGLFEYYVWRPFVAAGMPADQLSRITGVIERLRPVPTRAVVPYLALAMQRQVNAAIGEGLVGDPGRSGDPGRADDPRRTDGPGPADAAALSATSPARPGAGRRR